MNYIVTRAIGISTNSTEEVGRIYLDAIHGHVPLFQPVAYLGDAAEAFANAAQFVFVTIITRLMCFAHVYKVKIATLSVRSTTILTIFFFGVFNKFFQKGIEKQAKRIVDINVKNMFMQDINAISCAWTPGIAARLNELFFAKWDANNSQVVRDVTAHFRAEWCTERLGKWSCGHAHNCVINTNGLEATNKVIKDELTQRQLMPVIDFLTKSRQWLTEQSARRGEGPDKVVFATTHTFTTKDWTQGHAWRVNPSKQIRFVPQSGVYVAVAPGVQGHLTDERAVQYVRTFSDGSWANFDDFTKMYYHVCILTEDNTRPEMYSCTCSTNAKEFTCVHSLGLAMMRGTLNAPRAAQVQLLGRKRRRGRRPLAPPAWEMLPFAINSPLQHPQQDPAVLLGAQPVPNPAEGIAQIDAGLNLAEALLPEVV